jgi:DNA invertase Pin-like site-specific DNA recombinase
LLAGDHSGDFDQGLSIREAALRAAACELIRAEKRSGTTTTGRAEFQTMLEFVSKGDVPMVTGTAILNWRLFDPWQAQGGREARLGDHW